MSENKNSFNPFTMYNHVQPMQNPSFQFDDHMSFSSFLQGAVEYNNTHVPVMTNSSASFSSQEVGGEEDSSKSKGDLQARVCEDGEGKSKNVKAKKEEKKKEARFAFITKSEVDNLEDGYRWRKYGQKAVKNSPFPRSYYRCTSQKCNVKKRFERSHQDPTVVITTYEGQHNHHSPATIRGNAAMLTPNYPQDLTFFPTQHGQLIPHDPYTFLMNEMLHSTFPHKPYP